MAASAAALCSYSLLHSDSTAVLLHADPLMSASRADGEGSLQIELGLMVGLLVSCLVLNSF